MFGCIPFSLTDDVTADDGTVNTPLDLEDDVECPEGAVTTMLCMVDEEEGVMYMVAVLTTVVVFTLVEGLEGGVLDGGEWISP